MLAASETWRLTTRGVAERSRGFTQKNAKHDRSRRTKPFCHGDGVEAASGGRMRLTWLSDASGSWQAHSWDSRRWRSLQGGGKGVTDGLLEEPERLEICFASNTEHQNGIFNKKKTTPWSKSED